MVSSNQTLEQHAGHVGASSMTSLGKFVERVFNYVENEKLVDLGLWQRRCIGLLSHTE